MLGSNSESSVDEPTLPGSGAELGDYQIIARLGAGGMGQVFSARSASGEVVALKQLALTEPTLLYRFKREFRSLADLTHPNLVRLGELVVLESGLAFFTMELVEGKPLVRWVRLATPIGTAPNIHRLCHALRQLAEGVAHLHRHARLHRDLKPSNVHVTGEGRVVILDFGLVLELGERDARITATGQLVGTPAYMAPEQASHAALGPAVDLYAIGVILFECLTGGMPFVGTSIRVLLDKQREPAPDPRELAEGVPDWLARLCRALLDLDPEHRPSAEQIVALLDEHVTAAPLRIGVDESRGLRLFGRERELERLELARAQVDEREEATVVRVTGPPGRGKSALVEQFLQTVRDEETVILRGRCHRRESVPYKGVDSVVDAIARYLRSLPDVEAMSLRPRHARELCELFPVLGGIWTEQSRRAVEREPVFRRRLGIEALRELLARITDVAPLIVTIDDFQWADLDSLGVLRELLLPPLAPAMLVILAFDASADGPVTAAIREPDALRVAALVDIELEPLALDAAERLAEALLESSGAEAQAARELAIDSGGEPLTLVRGARLSAPGTTSSIADADVLGRVLELGPDARTLLELATVAGAALANELALAALQLTPAQLHAAADELVRAGLLAPVALEDRGIVRVARPRIAELVHVELDASRELALHLRLADTLVDNGGDAELIAEHFDRAGERERGRRYMVEAARAAADALAFVRAERLYRRALELLPDAPSDIELDSERAELQLALADQLVYLSRAREAADLYVEVARTCDRQRAASLELKAAYCYANAGWSQLALPLLRELMREAGEPLPITPFEVLLEFVRNQLALWWRGRRVRVRRAERSDASSLERVDLDHFDLVYAAALALGKRDILPAIALSPRILRLAYDSGDPTRLMQAMGFTATMLLTLGWISRSLDILDRARALAQEFGDSPALIHLSVAEMFIQSTRSELPAAVASYERARTGIERHPSEAVFVAPTLHNYTLMLRRAGEYQRLALQLPSWILLLRDLGHILSETLLLGEEAIILAQVGDRRHARASLDRARAGWTLESYTFVDYLLDLAEVWLLLAERQVGPALALAIRTEADLRRHGLARFKLPRVRMRETCLIAALLDAIARDDVRATPSQRDLRMLRRSGLPKFAATARILAAGYASLSGDVAREQALWRESLDECEAHSLLGFAAAVRLRLVELEVEDAVALEAQARAYLSAQKVIDVERFVDLLAPAKRKPERHAP